MPLPVVSFTAAVMAGLVPTAFTHLEGDALSLPIFGEGGTPKA